MALKASSARQVSARRPMVVVAAAPANWREALSQEVAAPKPAAAAAPKPAAPAAPRPASSSSATLRPSSRQARPNPASFKRTSPEAIAEFRREMGLDAPAAPKPAAAAAAPKPAAPAAFAARPVSTSSVTLRPSSRQAKPNPANFKRTDPEALRNWRRELEAGESSAAAPKAAASSSSSSSPASWRTASDSSSSSAAAAAAPQKTSAEAVASWRRELEAEWAKSSPAEPAAAAAPAKVPVGASASSVGSSWRNLL